MAIFENVHLFQIIVSVLVLFFLSRVLLRLRDGEVSASEFIFWTLLWGAVLVVTFVPTLLSKFSQSVGISRGLDFFVPLSLVFLLYLVFRAYIKIERVEQDLTKVVREVALRDLPKKKK